MLENCNDCGDCKLQYGSLINALLLSSERAVKKKNKAIFCIKRYSFYSVFFHLYNQINKFLKRIEYLNKGKEKEKEAKIA